MTIDTCIVIDFLEEKNLLIVNSPLLNKELTVPNVDFIGEYFDSISKIEMEAILVEVDIDIPEIV
ncbi:MULTISPECIES: hypothetical protein [Macrococcoides]|uniref:hypothetical protein n=1 Tax=Macrococcoides TaxID=3076173 RepID=UPI000C344337|nr:MULTISPECIES: hypothetical protein [Macrococcus]PKE18524.1 hypothetical protein CW679_10560 [Macrococcus caseolyticus]QNR09062.1 hypothetical protein GL258_12315 [Macrococcus canis]QYA36560.1 hypothetical protein KYI08_12220 [Macrococcus caseolyticus]